MAEPRDPHDPKGLIREAFRIDGITSGECRSIFLDWALSMPVGYDAKPEIEALLAKYEAEPADHPMKQVLSDGLKASGEPKRRGGRAARMGY